MTDTSVDKTTTSQRELDKRETPAGVALTVCSCAASIRMVPTPHIGSTTQKPGWGTAQDTVCVLGSDEAH